MHAIMVTDGNGQPIRVVCGFCRSEHNYRGGPRTRVSGSRPRGGAATPTPVRPGQRDSGSTMTGGRNTSTSPTLTRGGEAGGSSQGSRTQGQTFPPAYRAPVDPWPLVTARERVAPPVDVATMQRFSGSHALVHGEQAPPAPPAEDDANDDSDRAAEGASEPERTSAHVEPTDPDPIADLSSDTSMDLELLLRRIIREETGLTPVIPAEKWRGGELVLRPGKPGVAEKSWPIETFFHKVVMIRNRLRTLEQQLNASELPDDAKVKMQSYITGCYGSLTSFNVLFADEDDHFSGAGGE